MNLPQLSISPVWHTNAVVACRSPFEIQQLFAGRTEDASARFRVKPDGGGSSWHVEVQRPPTVRIDGVISARLETDPLIEWPFDTCQVPAVRNIDSIETGSGDLQRNRSRLTVRWNAPVAACQGQGCAFAVRAAQLP